MTKRAFGAVAVVLLVIATPAGVVGQGETSASAGSSVSFDAQGDALVDYTVDGESMAESVRVESQSQVRSSLSLSVSASLNAVAGIQGSALSVTSESDGRATIESDSGATLAAHDDGHGSLVVAADGEAQYVEVGLDAAASGEADGDNRVVVTNENGTQGTFLVVGDGDVTVNENGNVTASVEDGGRLVFRAYTEARTEADREIERLIAGGTATASVDLTGDAEQTVTYDDETTVDVTQRTESRVEMAVERASHDGKVVVASLAEGAVGSAEDVQVTVDGEAAVEVDSDAELEQAAAGGDSSAYVVRGSSQADASADVLVALNHFSTRNVAIQTADGSSGAGTDGTGDGDDGESSVDGDGNSDEGDAGTDDGDTDGASSGDDSEATTGGDGDTTGGTGPGLAALGAIVALVVVGVGGSLLGRRRR